jgi:hypothetical protein
MGYEPNGPTETLRRVASILGTERRRRVCRDYLAASKQQSVRSARLRDMDEHERFGRVLAQAIAEDVVADPPAGPVLRVVIRWFEPLDPGYFTVHVLGADDESRVRPQDAWYPLEWHGVDDDMGRTERLTERADIRAAAAPITSDDYDDEDEEYDEDEHGLAPRAIIAAVKAVPDALRAAGVDLDPRFAVSAAHFEGHGALATLRATDPAALERLEASGLQPQD